MRTKGGRFELLIVGACGVHAMRENRFEVSACNIIPVIRSLMILGTFFTYEVYTLYIFFFTMCLWISKRKAQQSCNSYRALIQSLFFQTLTNAVIALTKAATASRRFVRSSIGLLKIECPKPCLGLFITYHSVSCSIISMFLSYAKSTTPNQMLSVFLIRIKLTIRLLKCVFIDMLFNFLDFGK